MHQRFIGESEPMQRLFNTIEKLKDTDANILILGENGTGKDVIANLLYHSSPRAEKPFVRIDLGTIPEQLFESELFGHMKGALPMPRMKSKDVLKSPTGNIVLRRDSQPHPSNASQAANGNRKAGDHTIGGNHIQFNRCANNLCY